MTKSSSKFINSGASSNNTLKCNSCGKEWVNIEKRTLEKIIDLHTRVSHNNTKPNIISSVHIFRDGIER